MWYAPEWVTFLQWPVRNKVAKWSSENMRSKKADFVVTNRIALRKYLKKTAAARLRVPESALGWANGVLIYLSTGLTVEGVPDVHKPPKPKDEQSSNRLSWPGPRW